MSADKINTAEMMRLFLSFSDENLDSSDAVSLDTLIREKSEVRRLFSEYMAIISGLEYRTAAHSVSGILTPPESTTDDLFELLRLEQKVPLNLVEIVEIPDAPIRKRPGSDRPGKSAASQQSRSSAFQEPGRHRAITHSKVAACVVAAVLGICVFFMYWGDEGLTRNKPDIADSLEPEAAPVATLIASDSAVWAINGPADGDSLRAGQRLDLISGFAEITTNLGASALLRGPCSIELTKSNNELILNSGTLVGRCTTEHSRGFVVLTPTARVVDIGTEFSVSVNDNFSTSVQVLRGEVQVAAQDGSGLIGKPKSILAHQAVTINSADRKVEKSSFDMTVFQHGPTRYLSVIDIIAGGDGLGDQSEIGIDLSSGQSLTSKQIASTERESWLRDASLGNQPVNSSPFIDSVFVIDRLTGAAILSTDGTEFRGFPTVLEQINSKDAFGFIHATPTNTVVTPPSMPDILRPFSSAGSTELDGHYAVIHGGSGVTFDLQAIAQSHDASRINRFSAIALNLEEQSREESGQDKKMTADLWVIVDGVPRFTRRSTSSQDGLIYVDVPLGEEARFLTIAVSHGGDGIFNDWVVFARPQIEISVEDSGSP